MDIDPVGLLRLLSWLSPSLPTGAFAYSHGLEWAVESGDVRNVAGLVTWIGDVLRFGSGRSDGILVCQAHRIGAGPGLRVLAEQAMALAPSRERWEETALLGASFARAASVWMTVPVPIEAGWPLPVVLGAVFRSAGFDEEETVLGALHGIAANLVSAAVRLVPLGQTDGLRALAGLEATIADSACAARESTIDDLGGFSLGADLASFRHETQATRLFRS